MVSPPGPPTLRAVAELAGVSTATVARVIRADRRVAPETRQRVQAVIETTGYRVNTVARGLRRQRTMTVGHILQGISPNPFYTEVALGLQEEAAEHGFEMLIYNAQRSRARERAGVEAFIGRRVDAIVFTTPLDDGNVAAAAAAGTRIVQVERPTQARSATVTVDNYTGASQAVRHLTALGHRSIVFIGARLPEPRGKAGISVEHERLRGYLDTMRDAGLAPRTVLGEYDNSPSDPFQALGRDYMGQLLAEGPPPTAVFAASDLLAAGVLQALHSHRLRVPDTVSVVGFDDTYAAQLCPALTTVALPMRQLGAAAFRCAVAEEADRQVRLDSRLVVRESTGPPGR